MITNSDKPITDSDRPELNIIPFDDFMLKVHEGDIEGFQYVDLIDYMDAESFNVMFSYLMCPNGDISAYGRDMAYDKFHDWYESLVEQAHKSVVIDDES